MSVNHPRHPAPSKRIRLAIIAEGVETQAQKDFLAAHGCSAYQGYLFGPSLTLEGFEDSWMEKTGGSRYQCQMIISERSFQECFLISLERLVQSLTTLSAVSASLTPSNDISGKR